MTRYSGVIPPLVTPLSENGTIDHESLGRLVEHLLDGGVSGLFVLGSSGEGALLTEDQRDEVVSATVRFARDRVPVLAGAIEMSTSRVVQSARRHLEAGAQAVVVTAPFYTRTHDSEVERHFTEIAAALGTPTIAYDIPSAVHSKLATDVVLKLARQGTITALKDSSGDDFGLRRVLIGRQRFGLSEFSVLTGSELMVDTALLLGADGVVPGLGNVDPQGYVRLFNLVRAGDFQGARAEQERLIELFSLVEAGAPDRMGRGSSALGAFKAALELRGVLATHLTAKPYVALDDLEMSRVREALRGAALL